MEAWQIQASKEVERLLTAHLIPRLSGWWQQRPPPHHPEGLTLELLLDYAKPYASTLAWFGLLDSQDPLPVHHLIVRRALKLEGISDPSAGDVSLLGAALIVALRALRATLDLRADSFPVEELLTPRSIEGMFYLDAMVARFLETQPDAKEGSKKIAEWIRNNSKERYENYLGGREIATPFGRMACTCALWTLFCNDKLERENLPPFAMSILIARALWIDLKKEAPKTAPNQEPAKTQQEATPPAVVGGKTVPNWDKVATLQLDVARTYSRIYQLQQIELSQHHKHFLKEGEIVAEVATIEKKYLEPLQDKLLTLGNLSFRRAVNYLTRECWARYQAEAARPDIITFSGLKDFAEKIGEKSCESQAQLLELLSLGQAFGFSWPGGFIGGLWTYQYLRPAPGRDSWLQIKLSSVLEPHYGMDKLDSPWRVPIVKLPPMVGRFNDHAAQAAFAERLVIEMVELRLELYRNGGAKFTKPLLHSLSDEVGLRTDPYKLLSRWEQNDDDGDAFLERKGDLLILADNPSYRSARAFLLEAGRRSIESKEAAKRGLLIKQQRQGIKPKSPSPKTPKKK
jgi:hypothetical protein